MRKLYFIAGLFLFAFTFKAAAAEEGQQQDSATSRVVYSFLEKFPQAQAFREREKGPVFRGRWMLDRFQFDGLPGISAIFVSDSAVVEGRTRPVIWFQPLPGFESDLVFSKVPPGRKIRLFLHCPMLFFNKGKFCRFNLKSGSAKKGSTKRRSAQKDGNRKPSIWPSLSFCSAVTAFPLKFTRPINNRGLSFFTVRSSSLSQPHSFLFLNK